jgi:hypothetical protein
MHRTQRLIQRDVHSYVTGSCCYRKQKNYYAYKQVVYVIQGRIKIGNLAVLWLLRAVVV